MIRHAAAILIALGACLAMAGGAYASHSTVPSGSNPVLGAAGDISCEGPSAPGKCKQVETSDLLVALDPDLVIPLGDLQYEEGELANFQTWWEPSWGRLNDVTYPALGNHEYLTPNAQGYFDYWNGVGQQTGRAGDRDEGYYSFDIGTWHVIVLNSQCSAVGGCGAGSAQEQWLRADLAAHRNNCTLATMHRPRWTSAENKTNNPDLGALVQALYDHRAELLLAGDAHVYERFAMLDPTQQPDPARGIRQIVVGTGGKKIRDFGPIEPGSVVQIDDAFGVIKVVLKNGSYDWEFLPIAGQSSTDSGSGSCFDSGGTSSELEFTATHDATIKASSPNSNYGFSNSLQADGTTTEDFLLKFTVTGTSGQEVTGAKIRLHNTNSSNLGGIFRRVPTTSWGESSVTWNNAPAASPAILGSLGSVQPGNYYELDVSSAVSANGTYSFRVSSTSANGAHWSSAEAESSVAPTLVVEVEGGGGGPSEITLGPSDDAYVQQSQPSANFGSSSVLRLDKSPRQDLMLRFDVTGVGSSTATGVTLRLFNTNSSNSGGSFYRTAYTSWSEDTITWSSAPGRDPTPLDTLGSVQPGQYYEVDVSQLVTGDGPVSIKVQTSSSNGAWWSSKEGPSGQRPELVIALQ